MIVRILLCVFVGLRTPLNIKILVVVGIGGASTGQPLDSQAAAFFFFFFFFFF